MLKKIYKIHIWFHYLGCNNSICWKLYSSSEMECCPFKSHSSLNSQSKEFKWWVFEFERTLFAVDCWFLGYQRHFVSSATTWTWSLLWDLSWECCVSILAHAPWMQTCQALNLFPLYNSSFFTPSNVFISVHRNVKAENYSASSSSSKLTIRLLGNRFGSSFHCGSVINDRSCDMGDGLAFGFKNIVYYEVSFQKMTLFELNPCLYCVVW